MTGTGRVGIAGLGQFDAGDGADGGEPVGHGAGQLGGHGCAVGEAGGVHPGGVDALRGLHLVEEGGDELEVGIGGALVGGVPVDGVTGAARGDHDEAVQLAESSELGGIRLQQGALVDTVEVQDQWSGRTVRGGTAARRRYRRGRRRRGQQVPTRCAGHHQSLQLIGHRRRLWLCATSRGHRRPLAVAEMGRRRRRRGCRGGTAGGGVADTDDHGHHGQHRCRHTPVSSCRPKHEEKRTTHISCWARGELSPWSNDCAAGTRRAPTNGRRGVRTGGAATSPVHPESAVGCYASTMDHPERDS